MKCLEKPIVIAVLCVTTAIVLFAGIAESVYAEIHIEDAYTLDRKVYLDLFSDGERVEHGTIYYVITVEDPETGDIIYEKNWRKGYFIKKNSEESIRLHFYPKKIVGLTGLLEVRVVEDSGQEHEATFSLEF